MQTKLSHCSALLYRTDIYTASLESSQLKQNPSTYQPALPCGELEGSFSWTLPVPAGRVQGVFQESVGPYVEEEEGALACANRHYVFVETHRSNPCTRTNTMFRDWLKVYFSSFSIPQAF